MPKEVIFLFLPLVKNTTERYTESSWTQILSILRHYPHFIFSTHKNTKYISSRANNRLCYLLLFTTHRFGLTSETWETCFSDVTRKLGGGGPGCITFEKILRRGLWLAPSQIVL